MTSSTIEYKFNDTKLIIDENAMSTCIYSTPVKVTDDNTKYADNQFEMVRLDLKCMSLLQTFFGKDVANIIIHYNGHIWQIHMSTSFNSSNYVYSFSTLDITFFDCIFRCGPWGIDEDVRIFDKYCHTRIYDMTCLKYVIDNKLFESFVNMDSIQLFTACNEVSRDKFKIPDYPKFYSFMYHILTQNYPETILISNILFNMLKNKHKSVS